MSQHILDLSKAKEAVRNGKILYLISFTANLNNQFRTASFIYALDSEFPLWAVYYKLQEKDQFPQLSQYRDVNGILTITNIIKLNQV